MSKLAATTEITTAILSDKIESGDIALLARDPKNFIYSSYSIDMGDVALQVTHNDSSTINLVLPYYTVLEQVSSSAMSDDDLGAVAGGEIFGTIIAAIVGVAGVVSLSTGVVVGSAVAIQADRGVHLDGRPLSEDK